MSSSFAPFQLNVGGAEKSRGLIDSLGVTLIGVVGELTRLNIPDLMTDEGTGYLLGKRNCLYL